MLTIFDSIGTLDVSFASEPGRRRLNLAESIFSTPEIT